MLDLPRVGRLLLATCLARLAGRMFVLAIVLYSLGRFDSPALAGWVAFAAMGPGLLLSPLAGALLDRVGAAPAIVLDMLASALLLAVLVGAGQGGVVNPTLLLTIAALYSLTNPLSAAGIRALLPRLVPEAALDRANALDAGSYALIDVLGPALAGALVGFAGADPTLALIALLYAAAALCLWPLARLRAVATDRPPRSLLHEAAAGIGYLLRHPTLRGLALSYALYEVCWGILLVVVPVLVAGVLGNGAAAESMAGALWAVAGAAGGLGAFVAGHIRTREREARVIGFGVLATGLAVALVAVNPGLIGLGFGLAVTGFLAGMINVGVLTLRQRCTDPAWLGRVMAVSMSVNLSGLPIGSALGGQLVGHSAALALAAAAGVCLLSTLAGYVVMPVRAP